MIIVVVVVDAVVVEVAGDVGQPLDCDCTSSRGIMTVDKGTSLNELRLRKRRRNRGCSRKQVMITAAAATTTNTTNNTTTTTTTTTTGC
mmetsp:Transcript_21417/g.46525  ORF Transcript_21417/g.46525 Transcript_21417/m.46525 type:complete len:89 (+) Transcript_21417:1063-1329(+)